MGKDGVRWFSPKVLAKTGALAAGFAVLETYFDKRETQGGLAPTVGASLDADFGPTVDLADSDDLWVTFAADTGEADAATDAVARELVAPIDGDDGAVAPRLVILGGDEVYPSASQAAYEERLLRPWADALGARDPDAPDDGPFVVAIPGNHDWYDGLNAFLRVFAQGGHLGSTRCRLVQGRSYWTVRLPGNVWIWGADIEFGAYIDGPQRHYFEQAAAQLAGGRVILCVSKPFWYHDDAGYQANVAFLEHLVETSGNGTVVAMLTGDQHHYLRLEDEASGQQRVTCGGGGAFCHPTQRLAPGDRRTAHNRGGTTSTLRVQDAAVPDRGASKRLLWRALPVGFRSRGFFLLPLALFALYVAAAFTAPQARFDARLGFVTERSFAGVVRWLGSVDHGGWYEGPATLFLGSPGALVLDAVLIGLLVAFAMPGKFQRPAKWKRPLRGTLHALGWLASVWVGLVVGVAVSTHTGGSAVVALPVAAVVSCVLSSLVMGLYLMLSFQVGGWNGNEAYSAVGCNDYLHFLRIHVSSRQGQAAAVTLHPIRVDPAGGSRPIEPPIALAQPPAATVPHDAQDGVR